jgi:hypothetical protein
MGLLALQILAACAAQPGQPAPALEVAAAGDGNRARVTVSGVDAVVEVESERGIGELTLRHLGGPAPGRIELRLALAGLEQLEVDHDGGQLTASVASGPGHAIRQTMRSPDGGERALAPGDGDWVPIGIAAAEPEPPFPLAEGRFVVELPGALIATPSRTVTVRWIDFFR